MGDVDGSNAFLDMSFTMKSALHQPMMARRQLVDRGTMALLLEGGG